MAAQTSIPGCTHHPGMGFVYICKTCDNELLCMDCCVGRHNSHNLGKLTDYVSEQKREIRQYEKRLSKGDIPKLEGDVQENGENFKESCGRFRKMIEDIKRQGDQIKKEIDHLIASLVKLCSDLEKTNADITKKNKITLTKHLREEIRPSLDRCQRVLTSGTSVDVITVAQENRRTPVASPPTVGALKMAAFKPGVIHNGLLERMLGTVLVDGENPLFQPIPTCTVVSSFKTSFIYNVCRTCRSGDEAWLSYWKEDKIYRVDHKGNIQEKIKCKVKVKSIAVSPTTGRVWFCVQEDKSIREITSNVAVVVRFKVESVPRSLCITREDMVVVGMDDGIVLYTTDGRTVSDGAGGVCRQEAEVPHHMAYCTQTGDVAASDNDNLTFGEYMSGKEPGKQPRVLVMDTYLKPKFQYNHVGAMTPQSGEQQQSKFFPGDVSFDDDGDVLVVDRVTKSVMLIDGHNGHFLRTIYISSGSAPWCISLQDDRTLWIGLYDDTMKIIRYKELTFETLNVRIHHSIIQHTNRCVLYLHKNSR